MRPGPKAGRHAALGAVLAAAAAAGCAYEYEWTETNLPADNWLVALWSVGEEAVFAAGLNGNLLHSEDGARTWTREQLPDIRWGDHVLEGFRPDVWAIAGSGLDDLYIGGGSYFYVAEDGFVAPTNLQRSTDGGRTWTPLPHGSSGDVHTLWVDEPGRVWAGMDDGRILHSADHGRSWTLQTSGTDLPLWDFWGPGGGELYVIACRSLPDGAKPAGRALLHTRDGGTTWNEVALPGDWNPFGLWGRSADEVYLGGPRGALFRTRDRGRTWKELRAHGSSDAGVSFMAEDANGQLVLSELELRATPAGVLYVLDGMARRIRVGRPVR